ncbi:MAG: amidase [Chromatiales bacterium]|jgi:amidase|nr:amidase [Chromatiales bacterium]
MAFTEYEQFDACGLADLIRRREVSPLEVVDAAIDRIESRNPKLNAVVATCFGEARKQAAKDVGSGPLAGVPFLVKDLNTLVADMPATNGSRAFSQQIPSKDSTLVRRYREAGLIILGKTNTPELGMNVTTEPLLFGATRHPLDVTVSVGGSSGGSACAVASGMLPAAHATDSGGSIRIPASNCGLFGLKPTRGRVPLGNDQSEGLAGFSTANAVSHSVRDSAMLLDIASGTIPGAIYSAPASPGRYFDILAEPAMPLRIAVSTSGFAGESIHQDCANAAIGVANACEALGHSIQQISPDLDGAKLRAAFNVLFAANINAVVTGYSATLPMMPLSDSFEPVVLACADHGSRLRALDYIAAIQTTQEAARVMGEFSERFDVFITPTLANPPLQIGALATSEPNWPAFCTRMLDEIPFTPLYNATGAPAASIPFGHSGSGLPIGVQLGAALGCEHTILKLAAQLEAAHPWRRV